MNRQQRHKQERAEQKLKIKVEAFRQSNPLAEAAYQQGYNEGWTAALHASMKMYFAAAVLALHDLEGYGEKRNVRFLRLMERYATNALTSEEIIDDALIKDGVELKFDEPFEEDRIQEAEKT